MAAANKIALESAHYNLRTLTVEDASERWAQWLNDAGTARMLNAERRVMTIEEIRAHIASFDGRDRHLIGIFEKDGGMMVGLWQLGIDRKRKEFHVNVLVGETEARRKGAREETRDPLYRHFFNVLGMTAARCSVAAHNASTLRVMQKFGWELTGISHKPAADGSYPIELRHFRLPRAQWLAQRDPDAAA
jgi:RimJ/RimL family protein N-acetyltransferase